ncbi:MAG: PTS sugar transporter subunit IIA [Planctomycetota bacterium]|nr:PTS sugar transporter subunit IIA [Planctomycetota bacterium]
MDLTVADVARLLHASEKTIYRWIHEGTLPSYRINDKYRLNRVELLEWATARNIKLSPEVFDGEQAPVQKGLLADALRAGGVLYDVRGEDKVSALRAVCDVLPLPEGVNRDDLYAVLLARETLGSTWIGNGIAIPHPRSPLILNVKRPSVTLAFLRQPVDFGALDGKRVGVLFTIISTTIRLHLCLLSHLMYTLQDVGFARLLHRRGSAEEILGAMEQMRAGGY